MCSDFDQVTRCPLPSILLLKEGLLYHTMTYHVCYPPAGCTCVPQQRPSDVHGGLLRLPPGRVGTCAHRSAADQKGNTQFPMNM